MIAETDALGNPKPTFRWSFSQWENYNGCPQRWKFKSIMKLPSPPPGPAAARGLEMHERAEKYIKGEISVETAMYGDPTVRFGDKKPATIHKKYIPILDSFKHHPNGDKGTERKMAFDSEWSICSPAGRYAACIAVLDAYRYGGERGSADSENRVLRIGEWKSGSPKDTHADQRKLYAMFGLRNWLAHTVEVTTYYLEDTAPPVKLTVRGGDMDKLRAIWQPRIELMQRDQICAPRPGIHCNWCDYAKKKGGPCAFGG